MSSLNMKFPVISVLGLKNSGKTTVVEEILRKAVSKGLKVASAKHVSQAGFTIDTPGKDTWRHSEAGANPVISVSDVEKAVIYRRRGGELSLSEIVKSIEKVDLLVLEGFSTITLQDPSVGKIICVRDVDELEKFKISVKGEVIAFCSLLDLGDATLNIRRNLDEIINRTFKYVDRTKAIYSILESLPRLNCGKCIYKECRRMAEAIYRGEAELRDCEIIKARDRIKTTVIVNGTKIPLQPFVSEILRKSLLGMLSTLKGVEVEGNERIVINVQK